MNLIKIMKNLSKKNWNLFDLIQEKLEPIINNI